ncbi:MAG: beta-galactosidase [Candidatus Marinimicrobia bacterium]|nr:beta-galactosidase [Candidatus Neomarinimicrobiota bacterium]
MRKFINNNIQVFSITIWGLFFSGVIFGQVREEKNINQNWQFILPENEIDYVTLTDTSWKMISLPHTWNDKDIQSGNSVHYGTAWYKKILSSSEFRSHKRYYLRFEGVGQYAEVYFNHQFVGKHLGSYSAFVCDITGFIKPDADNILLVKVNNELNRSYPKDNFLFGIFGGIYRDVFLVKTDQVHISLTDYASNGVYVYQEEVEPKKARLKVIALVMNESSRQYRILVKNRLIDKERHTVTESQTEKVFFPGGLVPVEMELIVKNPKFWMGRQNPYLHRLETEIFINKELVDKVVQNIGIRSVEICPEKGFFLNGKPYKLYGVCRHQEWQNSGNALLPSHHKRDMEMIDDIGATSVRLAHYQQAKYMYDLADSLGLLVWAEIPFVNGYQEGADDNARQQMMELIKQNFNHPSIFTWGIHNEVIKGSRVQQPVQLTKELNILSKLLDPGRFTASVSNIWWIYDHEIHENTDLQGFNQYTGWYGGKPTELDQWIKNYHIAKADVRFSISEYGAGGNISHQSMDELTPPDPTGQFFPEGYQTYYHETTWTTIEKYPFIWASYVWNMFDFSVPEWNRGGIKGRNHKGLVTYDRKIKKDAYYWYKANWSEEPVLHLVGKRNNVIETNKIIFKVYCNFAVPGLYINGQNYGAMNPGINRVQYISPEIELEKGEYTIEVRTKDQDNGLVDSFRLTVR